MNANVIATVRPRPLPLTLDPLPDEDWCGYLRRLARRLGIDERALRLHLGMRPSRYGEMSLREQGIAITPATQATVGRALALNPRVVATMHLQVFDGGLLVIPAQVVASVDPAGPPSAVNSGGHKVQRCGWAHWRAHTHGCPECLRLDPTHWRLSWRLRWNVMCPFHRLLIGDIAGGDVELDDRVLRTQQRIMAVARGGRADNGMKARDLAIHLAALIQIQLNTSSGCTRRHDPLPTPRQLAELLPDAYRALMTTGPSVSQSIASHLRAQASLQDRRKAAAVLARYGVPGSSPLVAAVVDNDNIDSYRKATRIRRLAPDPVATDIGPGGLSLARHVPQVMPMHLFRGDLSDLCYPAPLHRGRSAASIACVVARCSVTAAGAAAVLDLDAGVALARLHWLLKTLQIHGREEGFWCAAREAWDALQAERVDYEARRAVVDTTAVLEATRAITGGRYRNPTIKRWLTEYWCRNLAWRSKGCGTGQAATQSAAALDVKFGAAVRDRLQLLVSQKRTA